MILTLFFITVTKSFSSNAYFKGKNTLEVQDLCQHVEQYTNLCIVTEIQSKHLTVNSKEDDTTFLVLLKDINDDQIINISEFSANGKIFLTSNRRLHIHINENLNISGDVVFNNFFLSASNLNLKENSSFTIDTITVDTINIECTDDFNCSSIKAQNFYSIQNNISIQINGPSNFNNIHKNSTVLTILNGQPPYFDFNLLNSTSKVVVYEETNTITAKSEMTKETESRSSFNLVAEFLGCRIPYYFDNQTSQCELCPENQAPLTDGSTRCEPCPNGKEYSKGSMSCVPCQPGTYYNQNTKKCISCPVGSYQPNSMQLQCLRCPENSTTINIGETSLYSCVCPTGYYGRAGEECRQCFDTEKCEYGSLFPRANAGFWIDENHFYYSVVCQPKYACLGNSTCSEGYEGKFCGSCSKGYFRLHQSCAKCNRSVPPILAILMILLVVLMFYFSVYNHKYFPMFVIFIHFFQEIAMFSFLNSFTKFGSSVFFSYLSFLYFNPQIFQPQCYGHHNWSPSIQIAIAIPIIIALILFICSLLSWAIPSLVKFIRRDGPRTLETFRKIKIYTNYNFFDCVEVFKESVAASFYVFFPAYFGLVMRTIKYSELTLGHTIKYLDIQPSMVFNDPTAKPAIITTIIVLVILFIFIICFDLKILFSQPKKNNNHNEEEEISERPEEHFYKVILLFNENRVVTVKGHCYTTIFRLYFWILIIHLKFALIFVSWIYLQRFLIFQYGFSLAIYAIYFSLQVTLKPYNDDHCNELAFISDLLKLFNFFVASTQVDERSNSPEVINVSLIFTSCLFLIFFILMIIQPIIYKINFLVITKKKSEKSNEEETIQDDFQELLQQGKELDSYIDKFIDGGFDSINKLMDIKDRKLKTKIWDIYKEFIEYAQYSKQDFRESYIFINHKFRPFALNLISKVILDFPSIYSIYLDQIANQWEYMVNKSNDSDDSD
ncbi:hypothetical protein M9Y10_022413 [Tritrichomonas musculus]|uniref:Tyrosine-protein kinase ephrin type A/B receptor-like domain-containing protein n=1 Tax=Tritrichomonas musculus TaxID=1915356 RepID=A0ABR2KSF0_9EUKA